LQKATGEDIIKFKSLFDGATSELARLGQEKMKLMEEKAVLLAAVPPLPSADANSFALNYAGRILLKIAGYDDSGGTIHSTLSQIDFKKNLETFYAIYPAYENGQPFLTCMISGLKFPAGTVIAAHLLPRRHHLVCDTLLSFNDINDSRNGLLIFRPFEWAFDTGKLSIIVKQGKYLIKIVDADLRSKHIREQYCELLNDEIADLQKTGKDASKFESTRAFMLKPPKRLLKWCQEATFGDFDGKELSYQFTTSKPFHRCLYFQWMMSIGGAKNITQAEKEALINDVGEFCSENVAFSDFSILEWLKGVE